MEFVLIGAVPVLLVMLATVMMVVSQVGSFLTYMRMSARQRAANRVIAGFIAKQRVSQIQLARRSRQLGHLSTRLASNNQELERLNTLKTRFLSMAAHDMRTPLASIRGFAGMLTDRRVLLGSKERRYVGNIMVAADQIGRLTGDLTDLAIIEAGKLKMEMAEFDAGDLIAELLPALSLLASNKGVDLRFPEAPSGMPLTGDRFRLGQVLTNLIGNAIKFTPSGGVVELRARAGAGGYLFAVTDSGPGIHPSEKDRVFEKFYQAQKGVDPKAKRQGWGLGLSIAQEIVRAHQGDIGVESKGLGYGAKFWFFVPAGPGVRTAGKAGRQALLAMASLLLGLFLVPAAGAQQTGFPLDDKARYDKFLEEKAESVLFKMLGPNKAKVVVDATVDFTRIEKFAIVQGAGQGDGKKGEAPPLFAWQSVTSQAAGASEFLPGVPMPMKDGALQGAGQPQSYERSMGFPASFLKRLAVTLILDKSVPVDQADNLQTIISDLLEIDPSRGDSLTMVKAQFAPAWKTLWQSAESFSMVFRYTLLALLTLITLVVVATCFLKLADAMDSMAKAQQQNYGMDLNSAMEEADKEGEAEEAEVVEEDKKKELEHEPHEDEVIIEVREDQLDTLVTMIAEEDADNVALVVSHLTAEMRRSFLKKLPSDKEADVLVRLAEVRFVEPGVVASIKEELERRLANAVGGLGRVFQIIDEADPALKREMLFALQARDPDLARQVRSRVLLMEDLMKMGPQDWALLMSRISILDWAAALKDASQELRIMLRSQMMPKTWAILEQTMSSSAVSPDKVALAQGNILGEVWKMINAGQIQNPLAGEGAALPMPSAPEGTPA